MVMSNITKANESDSSEQLREYNFEEAFLTGLGLSVARNKEFVKILNIDSFFKQNLMFLVTV